MKPNWWTFQSHWWKPLSKERPTGNYYTKLRVKLAWINPSERQCIKLMVSVYRDCIDKVFSVSTRAIVGEFSTSLPISKIDYGFNSSWTPTRLSWNKIVLRRTFWHHLLHHFTFTRSTCLKLVTFWTIEFPLSSLIGMPSPCWCRVAYRCLTVSRCTFQEAFYCP